MPVPPTQNDLLRKRSSILSEQSRQFYWQGAGLLSLKTFQGGTAQYRAAGHARYAVDARVYLILNHGQHYEIEIDAPTPVQSFCLFFRKGMVEQVQHNLIATSESLLDDPSKTAEPIHFFERTYPHGESGDLLSPYLLELRQEWDIRRHDGMGSGGAGRDPFALEERLWTAASLLLCQHRRVCRESERLNAVRPATREELYRRLHLAHDFADACFAEPLSLDDMAAVACLSPNHLLRTFPLLFGKTPHQYLTERRLAEARRLLRETELPVTDICCHVGFVSLGSFSSLFARRHGGLSPEHYRHRKVGDFEEAPRNDFVLP